MAAAAFAVGLIVAGSVGFALGWRYRHVVSQAADAARDDRSPAREVRS